MQVKFFQHAIISPFRSLSLPLPLSLSTLLTDSPFEVGDIRFLTVTNDPRNLGLELNRKKATTKKKKKKTKTTKPSYETPCNAAKISTSAVLNSLATVHISTPMIGRAVASYVFRAS